MAYCCVLCLAWCGQVRQQLTNGYVSVPSWPIRRLLLKRAPWSSQYRVGTMPSCCLSTTGRTHDVTGATEDCSCSATVTGSANDSGIAWRCSPGCIQERQHTATGKTNGNPPPSHRRPSSVTIAHVPFHAVAVFRLHTSARYPGIPCQRGNSLIRSLSFRLRDFNPAYRAVWADEILFPPWNPLE